MNISDLRECMCEKRSSEIGASDILQKVIFVIRQANIDILATMKLSEEISNPISAEYFKLLEKKMNEGVFLFRIAFGSMGDLCEFEKRCPNRAAKYKCVLTRTQNYQRMLLVDHRWLFFAIDTGGERKFFFTEDNVCIEVFERYFSEEILEAGKA